LGAVLHQQQTCVIVIVKTKQFKTTFTELKQQKLKKCNITPAAQRRQVNVFISSVIF